MLKKLKHTFITLGVASGMTAAALAYVHTSDNCRDMILRDAGKNQTFMDNVAQYQVPQDFLTAMKKSN